MAFGGLGGEDEAAPMADINMVPMIDVMLVLLIIFIVAAPLMHRGVAVELPRTAAAPLETPPEPPLELAVDAAGQWSVDGEAVDDAALPGRLEEIARTRPDTEVRIRADRQVPYGRVARLMAVAANAGLNRLAFEAERPAHP